MTRASPLEASLQAFLETFQCPCCRGNTFTRESVANPSLMAGMRCSCGTVIMFLYNYEAERIVWSATKDVVAHGRPWMMQYASWNDRTLYSNENADRSFEGWFSPERFANLVVYL